ncbi:MAG: hypothetical protein JOZ54_03870 [Acidobacteria bacterium]|nr:hypothetical protein [Acidobacteriota bacterium]
MIFLIDYDRARGELTNIQMFHDADRRFAEDSRLNTELAQLRDGVKREVVLLQAANEQALRRTHRRYFADIAELAETDSQIRSN